MANILAVGAHADDIEIGCSSTLHRHILNGDKVTYVCMTSGESLDGVSGSLLRSKDQSRAEVELACGVIGISDIVIFDNIDLRLEFGFKTVSELEAIIRGRKIDTMYTHFYGDANQDHIATHRISMAAGRYVNRVLCYEQIPIPRLYASQFSGNVYVPYDSFRRKAAAIRAHSSQTDKYSNIDINIIYNTRIRDMANALHVSDAQRYAERFEVIKYVI